MEAINALYRLLCGILDSSQGSRDIPFELISAQNDSVCYARVCAVIVRGGWKAVCYSFRHGSAVPPPPRRRLMESDEVGIKISLICQ